MGSCNWNYTCSESKCVYSCKADNSGTRCSEKVCFENCPEWSRWSSCLGKQLTDRIRKCQCEHIPSIFSKDIERDADCLQQKHCLLMKFGAFSKELTIAGTLFVFTVLIFLLASYFWCKKYKGSPLEDAVSVGESGELDVEDASIPRPRHRALPAHLIENLPSEYVNTEGQVRATLPAYGDSVDGANDLPPPYMYIARGSFFPSANHDNETSENCPPSYRTSLTTSSVTRCSRHQAPIVQSTIRGQERF